ncbi:uncharacterized protein LY89DRAFT_680166 [Mollisia scopiformis]|uniref:Uncharacterized protein n=1 Tax=Mollisia scopiformis TaxID=149040 RepID=A0A194XUM3_MOLSC|nr:uncharacterized protein LY89DRAFT_680166 [Mollisia scopiformis]KUJ23407.1 hypothetical protein LY89DRAFT_680166 [Mollisia scopiformis]
MCSRFTRVEYRSHAQSQILVSCAMKFMIAKSARAKGGTYRRKCLRYVEGTSRSTSTAIGAR